MQRQNQILSKSARANPTATTDNATSSTTTAGTIAVARVISPDSIRLYAYQKWEIAGKPGGDGIPFWLEAENELADGKQDTSGRGNSQDADRHSGIRHPHSLKL